jgi:hypothetical protein
MFEKNKQHHVYQGSGDYWHAEDTAENFVMGYGTFATLSSV